MIEVVVFDLDDTLLPDKANSVKALRAILQCRIERRAMKSLP